MATVVCPKCGKEAGCFAVDLSCADGNDYTDLYVMHCADCGHFEFSEEDGGSVMEKCWNTTCPYCKGLLHEHGPISEELIAIYVSLKLGLIPPLE